MIIDSGRERKVGRLYGVCLLQHRSVTPENEIPKPLKMEHSAESWSFYSGGKGRVGLLQLLLCDDCLVKQRANLLFEKQRWECCNYCSAM